MSESNNIYPATFVRKCTIFIGILGAAVGVFSVFIACAYRDKEWMLFAVVMLWGLAPPVWFFIEYHWFFRKYGNQNKFDEFKYSQDLATKVWAGVAAVLILIATKPDIICKI